jgi:hypothetical protein
LTEAIAVSSHHNEVFGVFKKYLEVNQHVKKKKKTLKKSRKNA